MQIQKAESELTPQQRLAIQLLCDGNGMTAVASEVGVDVSTVTRWKKDPYFQTEYKRESQRVGLADQAERLRIANMVVRSRVSEDEGKVYSKKDTLAWLEYIAKETGQWNASQELTEIKRKMRLYRILLNLLKHETCEECKMHVWNRLGDPNIADEYADSEEDSD